MSNEILPTCVRTCLVSSRRNDSCMGVPAGDMPHAVTVGPSMPCVDSGAGTQTSVLSLLVSQTIPSDTFVNVRPWIDPPSGTGNALNINLLTGVWEATGPMTYHVSATVQWGDIDQILYTNSPFGNRQLQLYDLSTLDAIIPHTMQPSANIDIPSFQTIVGDVFVPAGGRTMALRVKQSTNIPLTIVSEGSRWSAQEIL